MTEPLRWATTLHAVSCCWLLPDVSSVAAVSASPPTTATAAVKRSILRRARIVRPRRTMASSGVFECTDMLAHKFTRTIAQARATSPDAVGKFEFDDGDEVLMRLGEFVPSRMVEAVVHSLDLTDALGHDPVATPEGVAMTAAIFDELLARMTVPGRPPGLTDDLAWVRAASGRTAHSDPRLPLLG